ncbi:MAG: hypothetical protein QG641_2274 [Candidatus Poribacteria bacterium]|nr:hypothetical protein [Candidatus Poribacteria bacterium]
MEFKFKHHIIDTLLPVGYYAQTTLADIDGDGKLEYIVGCQYGDIYWYKYHSPDYWTRYLLGDNSPSDVGGCVIDVDGDGNIDVIRTDVWFQNVNGDGKKWVQRPIGPNTPPSLDFQPYFAFNATRSIVCDMNSDGKNDIVFTDAEIPGGKVYGGWKILMVKDFRGNGMRFLMATKCVVALITVFM